MDVRLRIATLRWKTHHGNDARNGSTIIKKVERTALYARVLQEATLGF